jgi:segregation and condensation protein B
MNSHERKVEAVLFAIADDISLKNLSSLVELSEEETSQALKKLKDSYVKNETSLTLLEREKGWKLSVKPEYLSLVSQLVKNTELDKPLMETLAVIAWKYPVVQSEIVKLRGTGAYEQMKILQDEGFINKIRSGRTYKVNLTEKFFNYFDLPTEEAKEAFLKKIPSEILQNAIKVDKESDEVERLTELDKQKKENKSEIEVALSKIKED